MDEREPKVPAATQVTHKKNTYLACLELYMLVLNSEQ